MSPSDAALLSVGYAPGSYCSVCAVCRVSLYDVDKRTRVCFSCAVERLRDKQEREQKKMEMNAVRKYVLALPTEQVDEIIKGYYQFERDGFIGDEPIRQHAEKIAMQLNGDTSRVVLWMERLVFECFREYAWRYMELRD